MTFVFGWFFCDRYLVSTINVLYYCSLFWMVFCDRYLLSTINVLYSCSSGCLEVKTKAAVDSGSLISRKKIKEYMILPEITNSQRVSKKDLCDLEIL